MLDFGYMKKTIIWVIVILLVIWALVAMGGKDEEDKIKVGVLAPMTDIFAEFGEVSRQGVMDADTWDGIEFVFEDTQCDPAKALSAYNKLVEFEKIQFVIGPGCGSPQEVVASRAVEDDVVVLLPSAAPRSLHEVAGGKLFNTQYSLEDEAKFIAQKFEELGHQRAVMFTYQNAFSKAIAEAFKENYKGEVVRHVELKDETVDPSTELTKLRNEEFDVLFAPDLSFFFSQGYEKMKQYGIDVPVFLIYTGEFEAVRDLVDGVYYSHPSDVSKGGDTIYTMAKLSAELISNQIKECDGEYQCVLDGFQNSPLFGDDGVRKQGIVLKRIVDGKPVFVE